MNAHLKRGRGRPPSPSAEHRRAADELRHLVASPNRRAGDVLPSLRQLAADLKTSFSAVRQAVEILKKEQRIAVNPRKRLVAMRPFDPAMDGRGVVLIVSADPLSGRWSPYHTALMTGVLQGVGDIGAPMLLAHGVGFRSALPVGFLDYPLRGIILVGHFKPDLLREYERLPLPVVIADTPANEHKIHSVCVDNIEAMRETVKRLAALGHRRIAFIRFILYSLRDIDPDSRERHAGFVQGCREAGLPIASDWTFNMVPNFKASQSSNLRRVVGRGSPFTAVITTSPEYVLQEATEYGKKVPEQLSVVTVNTKGAPARYSGPAVDFTDLGRRAAPLLNQPKSPPIRIRVPTEWHDAGSVKNLTT
ncbi:MAG: substrate-binding domain-containing protein [Planctomycetes bacterium]|nr:substrate-binding domain-containing protein [Planctomycetota bacterium]